MEFCLPAKSIHGSWNMRLCMVQMEIWGDMWRRSLSAVCPGTQLGLSQNDMLPVL